MRKDDKKRIENTIKKVMSYAKRFPRKIKKRHKKVLWNYYTYNI